MKYRTDFVTNSSSSSSVVLTMKTNKSDVYINYHFDEPGWWRFEAVGGINESGISYKAIIDYLIETQYRVLFYELRQNNSLYKNLLEVLYMGLEGTGSIDEDELKKQLSLNQNPLTKEALTIIDDLLKVRKVDCKTYNEFLKHPIWKTMPYASIKPDSIISLAEKLENWDGDSNTEITKTTINLKNLQIEQEITEDPEELYYSLLDRINELDADDDNKEMLRETLDDAEMEFSQLKEVEQLIERIEDGDENVFEEMSDKQIEEWSKLIVQIGELDLVPSKPVNFGKKWTPTEHTLVANLFEQKSSISAIAKKVGRDIPGILFELQRQELIDDSQFAGLMDCYDAGCKNRREHNELVRDLEKENEPENLSFEDQIAKTIQDSNLEIEKDKQNNSDSNSKKSQVIICKPLTDEEMSQDQLDMVYMLAEGKDEEALEIMKTGFKWEYSFDRNVNLLMVSILYQCKKTAIFLIDNDIDLDQKTTVEIVGADFFRGQMPVGMTALKLSKKLDSMKEISDLIEKKQSKK